MIVEPARTLLTRRQRSVLTFLRRHIRTRGYSPSNAEVAEQCGLGAPSGAQRIISVLEERGYVCRRDGRNRAVELAYPSIGEVAPGSVASFVLTAIRSFQRTVRGRLLATVVEVEIDDDTMGALLADASARNEFMRRYRINKADESGALQADSFDDLLAQLSQRSTWPEFVVDHAVFNAGSRAAADQVLTILPNLEPALLDIIDMSDAALTQCRRWLANILATGKVDPIQLQRRAVMMEHVTRVVANIVTEQLGRDQVLGAEWGSDPLRRLLRAPDSESLK
jgi:LexA DNA binding domain